MPKLRQLLVLALAAAAAATNTYTGAPGGAWFASASGWSGGSFPTYPETVEVGASLRLTKPTNGATRLLVLENGAMLTLGPASALEIGPSACDPTQYEEAAPTASADRVCLDHVVCGAVGAQWMQRERTATEHRVCADVTDCGVGEGMAAKATATADRQCAACVGGSTFSDAVGGARCTDARAPCVAGEHTTVTASASRDRQCGACGAGTFTATAGRRSCTTWRTCAVGEGKAGEGTATRDRQCAACAVGASFSDANDGAVCTGALACKDGEYETQAATATSDRTCATHSAGCPGGQYTSTAPHAHADRVCSAIRTCAAGLYEMAAPGASSDRVCEACAAGRFKVSAGNAKSCTVWRTCPAGTGLDVEGSGTADRQCVTCVGGATFSDADGGAKCADVREPCPAGARISADATASSDMTCAACEDGKFTASAGRASCRSWRRCYEGKGLYLEGTATADRKCRACELGATFSDAMDGAACKAVRAPCPAGERTLAAATVSSDLVCDHCAAGHYTPGAGHSACIQCNGATEWQASSRSAGCDAVTTCLGTEYEVSPPTHLVDRVCAPITKCTPGMFQTTAPTRVRNRVCSSCAPGRAQHLPEAKWCPQCERGRYQGQKGATDCVDCDEGAFGSATGLTACTACEVGRFADQKKTVDCKFCAVHQFAAAKGAAACATCDYHCASGTVKHSCGKADAGTCVSCRPHEFKASDGTHGCVPHVAPSCQEGHRQSVATSATADRECTICGEFEHKPLAGNDAACAACPLGYRAYDDRKSCFAYKCSHIRCKYEEHTCRWGRPDKDLRAWVGLTFHAQPGDTCENGARYTSVRVDHGTNLACAPHRADRPGDCRNLPHEEEVCRTGHHCGLGLVSGDKSSCECMPLAAPSDFPTNKPSAYCAECAAYDSCAGAGMSAVAGRRLAGTAQNGKPCNTRPEHCGRCETLAQREERKAVAVTAAAAAKAAHDSLAAKTACFATHKAEQPCRASAHCTWAAGVGCIAFFSAAERAELEAENRRREFVAEARATHANELTVKAAARNEAARAYAKTWHAKQVPVCTGRTTLPVCNAVAKCSWDPVERKCFRSAKVLLLAAARSEKAAAAESAAKAAYAGTEDMLLKAREASGKVQAQKDASAAGAAELVAKHAIAAAKSAERSLKLWHKSNAV